MPPETIPSAAPTPTRTTKEDDDSRAGSMTLLLPEQAMKEKQVEQGLPLPTLPTLQCPRKRPVARPVIKTSRASAQCSGTSWILALLAAAAIMAAVAAAAMAMAARAEIFRLKADVDHLRNRIRYHEATRNIEKALEPAMAPGLENDDEDSVWDFPQSQDDLSPSYPEMNEFEFPADIKGNSAPSRHSRRHIPTVGGSYVSSENGWRPEKSEKRLKLYEDLATATYNPGPTTPSKTTSEKASARARATARPRSYHHRSNNGRLIGRPPALLAPPSAPASAPPADKVVVARRQDPTDT